MSEFELSDLPEPHPLSDTAYWGEVQAANRRLETHAVDWASLGEERPPAHVTCAFCGRQDSDLRRYACGVV